MKHVLLISIIATLASCGNNKTVIVEQIKAYRDSIGVVEKERAKMLDEIMAIQDKYIGQQAIDSVSALEQRHAAKKTRYWQGN